MTRPPRDRGAADALGLVLIAPVAIGLAVLVVALGRDVDARAQARSAAAAGAQAAALERDPVAARRAAVAVISSMLGDDRSCVDPTVDLAYPAAPEHGDGITFGTVAVTVDCTVSDEGVELVRPGARRTSFTATATVDFFRQRGGP